MIEVVSTNDYQLTELWTLVSYNYTSVHQRPPEYIFRQYQWRVIIPWNSVSRDELQTVPFAGVATARAEGTVSISFG